MLQARNLSNVLSQVIQHEKPSERHSIVSSILITVSGQPVASYHTNRPPPPPHTIRSSIRGDDGIDHTQSHDQDTAVFNSAASTTSKGSVSSHNSHPYQVNRTMKTKLYALFASQAWSKYQQAGMGHITAASDGKRQSDGDEGPETPVEGQEGEQSYANQHDWICFKTEDATRLIITPVNLQSTSSQLLLIVVADDDCPLGLILRKSQETVKVLEEGLDKYRVFD